MCKRLFLYIIALWVALCLTACNKPDDKATAGLVSNGAEDTSIINLIATPEHFAGKLVRVTGVMVLELEGDAIYLSASDAERRITKNGIWLEMDYAKLGLPEIKPSDPEQLQKAINTVKVLKDMNGNFVVIEGVFDMNSRGHLGLFAGSLNVAQMPRLRGVEKIRDFGPKASVW